MSGAQGSARSKIDAPTPPSWAGSLIKPGDILLSYFPYDEAPDDPGPKYHPVLVLAANRRVNPWQLFVAYGTSSDLQLKFAWQFIIPPLGDQSSAKRANRTRPTKFDLKRTVLLNYNEAWFARPSNMIYPRMGELDQAGKAVFEQARTAYEVHVGTSLIPGKPALITPTTDPDEPAAAGAEPA